MRPMLGARKVWGGNRTPLGTQTQSILVSFLQTLPPATPSRLLAPSQSPLFLSAKVLDLAALAR